MSGSPPRSGWGWAARSGLPRLSLHRGVTGPRPYRRAPDLNAPEPHYHFAGYLAAAGSVCQRHRRQRQAHLLEQRQADAPLLGQGAEPLLLLGGHRPGVVLAVEQFQVAHEAPPLVVPDVLLVIRFLRPHLGQVWEEVRLGVDRPELVVDPRP